MIIAPVSTITLLLCRVLFAFQFDTPLPEPVDTDPVTQPQDTAPTGTDPAYTEPVKMEPGTDSFVPPIGIGWSMKGVITDITLLPASEPMNWMGHRAVYDQRYPGQGHHLDDLDFLSGLHIAFIPC